MAVVGLALVVGGELEVMAATTNYDHALGHDCTAGGCSSIGPLGEQTDYLEGEVAVASGVIVLAVALFTAVRARAQGPLPRS
jgi:hypothetical protein